ncbi:hypothetical protein HSIVP1_921 [Veillonella parvula HSIVP1]|nr:hypothetical protein [Veillonella parvula]EQC67771.1 hypothetical protein HSIVP1_921 [Veillonella parvula HSIVP1]
MSFSHSETLKNSNKPQFVWTKDDLGKSIAQNVLSEVANQPWVGYVHYAEKASNFTRTVARRGGPVGTYAGEVIGATAGDYAKDRIKYNLKKDTDK